jgi:hypothetical protein
LLKSVASDFQVIYLTTSARYDEAADAVVVLDGPTSVDSAAPLVSDVAMNGTQAADAHAASGTPTDATAPAETTRPGRRA